MLEKILESPFDIKEIQPVNPKGNQPWIFIGRTDAKAEAPILWPPDAKSQLIRKDPDAGEDWRQDEKGMTEDEKVGWHHWLDGHEFDQAPGVSDGQGSLVCCSLRGHKESGMTEWPNWTDQDYIVFICKSRCLSVDLSLMFYIARLFTKLFFLCHFPINKTTMSFLLSSGSKWIFLSLFCQIRIWCWNGYLISVINPSYFYSDS